MKHILITFGVCLLVIMPSTIHAQEETASEPQDTSIAESIPDEVKQGAQDIHFFLESFRQKHLITINEKRSTAHERMQALRGDDGFDEEGSVVLVFIGLSWWQVLAWIFGSMIIFYIVLGLLVFRILSWLWGIISRKPDWDM